jgi:hypothetical protein
MTLSATLLPFALLASTVAAHEITILAGVRWACTGYQVDEGHRYRIAVKDMSTVWDARMPVRDLNGWPSRFWTAVYAPVFWTRRRPFDPWFSLIATVDGSHPRRLRADAAYTAPATGHLLCYFNDFYFAYGNNQGAAVLTISPLP